VKRIFIIALLTGILLLAACQPAPAAEPPAVMPPAAPEADVETQSPAEPAPADTPALTPTTALSEPESAPAPASSPLLSTPAEEIIAALLALREQKSFRVESTITYDDFSDYTEMHVVPPDRIRLIAEDYEMILIEDRMYILDGDEWLEMPGMLGTINNLLLMFTQEEVQELREGMVRAEYLGEEMLDGERTRVYLYGSEDEEMGVYGEVMLWIAISDGLLRKIETIPLVGEEEDGMLVNLYKDYNLPLNIEPPN
jgi:hypothetical protein